MRRISTPFVGTTLTGRENHFKQNIKQSKCMQLGLAFFTDWLIVLISSRAYMIQFAKVHKATLDFHCEGAELGFFYFVSISSYAGCDGPITGPTIAV